MDTIKLSPEHIKEAANSIKNATGNIDDALTQFGKICNKLAESFKGEVGNETYDQAVKKKDKLTQINDELKSLAALIDKHSDRIRDIQTELKNASRTLEQNAN